MNISYLCRREQEERETATLLSHDCLMAAIVSLAQHYTALDKPLSHYSPCLSQLEENVQTRPFREQMYSTDQSQVKLTKHLSGEMLCGV